MPRTVQRQDPMAWMLETAKAALEQSSKPGREAAWFNDPAKFAREALGVQPWAKQVEICEAVVDNARVAVRSGHKIGKSNIAVTLALWWAYTRPRARVVMTSASTRQIRRILWKELRLIVRNAKVSFPVPAEMPDNGMQWDDGREVFGFSTNEPERMAGLSGDQILFLLDEASGINEEIFEAIEGNRAGGARLVLFSNPTQTSGTFYDAFTSKRDFWHTIHVSSEETPNVIERRIVVPGLATHQWVDEKLREWGEDSPLFQVRVRGNFPSQAENAVIPLGLVEAASVHWDETPEEGRLEIGVDVARFGDDDSVIRPRRGLKALAKTVLQGADTVEVAGNVLEVVRALRRGNEKARVKVDVIGVGGGVADILRRHRDEIDLVEVNVSEKATAEGYVRLRDQLWFALADWLRGGGTFEADGRLEAELVAPTYSFDPQGRQKVESKDEIKKRLKRSPDDADALALAVYSPVSLSVHKPRPVPSRWGNNHRGY